MQCAAGDAWDPVVKSIGFFFDYIDPAHPDCRHIIKRLLHGRVDPSAVPRSGPAPALMRFSELKAVVPLWEKVTAEIEGDEEAKKVLDWVREMYAWDVAVTQAGVPYDVQRTPSTVLMAQPPHDLTMGAGAVAHYTWGVIYREAGKDIWKWDKREYTSEQQAKKVCRATLGSRLRAAGPAVGGAWTWAWAWAMLLPFAPYHADATGACSLGCCCRCCCRWRRCRSSRCRRSPGRRAGSCRMACPSRASCTRPW